MRNQSLLAVWSIALWACGTDPRGTGAADRGRADLSAPLSHEHESIVVDDDRADCPEADFTSIQAAVAAAAPGDEIVVCAGIYREQVTVSKNGLAIRAERERGEGVVDARGHDFGFWGLNASRVPIEGFRIEHGHEADIALDGTTSTTIRKNATTTP